MVASATSAIAKLELLSNEMSDRAFDLTDDRVSIGRDSDNIIPLRHITVSLHHALLVRVGQHYKVRDLVSTNGTYVNDERTTGTILKSGDRVRFGEIEFLYRELL